MLISRHGIKRLEPVASGRIFVDGKGIGDVGEVELGDRHSLARNGTVLAVLAINQRTGAILHGPELLSRGCIAELDHENWLHNATYKVEQMLDENQLCATTDWDELRIEIRQTISRFFKRSLQRRPLIIPIIIQL
ncbi:MAG: hypothetical protein B6I37_08765 [Desulfobacteraceae bacterium 4572_35.2]|nr:MAG: hypothetical protein B6I37_08765 [Desulfobacteraceae bacterium 4572_35.2]